MGVLFAPRRSRRAGVRIVLRFDGDRDRRGLRRIHDENLRRPVDGRHPARRCELVHAGRGLPARGELHRPPPVLALAEFRARPPHHRHRRIAPGGFCRAARVCRRLVARIRLRRARRAILHRQQRLPLVAGRLPHRPRTKPPHRPGQCRLLADHLLDSVRQLLRALDQVQHPLLRLAADRLSVGHRLFHSALPSARYRIRVEPDVSVCAVGDLHHRRLHSVGGRSRRAGRNRRAGGFARAHRPARVRHRAGFQPSAKLAAKTAGCLFLSRAARLSRSTAGLQPRPHRIGRTTHRRRQAQSTN